MSFEKPWGNYLLDKIVETAQPEHISYWPQTLAWKIILTVVFIFIIHKSYQRWKQYKNNRYRREALAWLQQCSLDNETHVRQLPSLLRKTALLANALAVSQITYPLIKQREPQPNDSPQETLPTRDEITLLSGDSWAKWLDIHCPKSQFSAYSKDTPKRSSVQHEQDEQWPYETLLSELPYMPSLELNNPEFTVALANLYQQIVIWVEHHHISYTVDLHNPPSNEGASL